MSGTSAPSKASQGKRVLQLVKYVTGKSRNNHTDYECVKTPDYYGFETYTLKGSLGFIRIALTPLFEVINTEKT